MSLVCKYCGSDNLGWDVRVDQNDEVIVRLDHYECLSCESNKPELMERGSFTGPWSSRLNEK